MKASAIARLSSRPDVPGENRLILPPTLDLVVGVEAVLWLEQICVAEELPAFTLQGPGAIVSDTHWAWTPEASDVGTRKIRLSTGDGTISRTMTIRPAVAPGSPSLKVLCIGASFLTAAPPANWIEYADDALIAAGVDVTWLGTDQAVGQSAHIFSESQAGSSFVWWSGQDQGGGWGPCPFQFGDYGDPIDVLRYGEEELGGEVPDVVVMDINTNDYATLDLESPAALATIMANADTVIDALRAAWPNAWICWVVAPPCDAELHPLGDDHRLRRHLYGEEAYEKIRTRRAAGQRVTACQELGSIDPDAGFDANDHWNSDGAQDIGRAMHTFLRRFAA